MAEEQFINLTLGWEGSQLIDSGSLVLYEEVSVDSKDNLHLDYNCIESLNGIGHTEKTVDLTFDEGGEREFLQRKLGDENV